ncbi:uncharacterized protein LOC143025747 [Oratosquilla oratoria]|uniref:uncharacterized protein LOC143025747 n=1 Tax=Oratosquilla oratoria TaxID=337810 RepID=UPI003F76AC1F
MLRLTLSVVVLIALQASRTSLAQHLENDLQAYLRDLDVNPDLNQIEPDAEDDFEVELSFRPEEAPSMPAAKKKFSMETLRREWGVPDTEAIVGQLFSHRIPDNAFAGEIDEYQVRSKDL